MAPVLSNREAGISTGLAVMNLEEVEITLDVELLDNNSSVLTTAQFVLSGAGQQPLFVDELEWNDPVDFDSFEGLLRVGASGRAAATVIQTRPGQFATMPVSPTPAN